MLQPKDREEYNNLKRAEETPPEYEVIAAFPPNCKDFALRDVVKNFKKTNVGWEISFEDCQGYRAYGTDFFDMYPRIFKPLHKPSQPGSAGVWVKASGKILGGPGITIRDFLKGKTVRDVDTGLVTNAPFAFHNIDPVSYTFSHKYDGRNQVTITIKHSNLEWLDDSPSNQQGLVEKLEKYFDAMDSNPARIAEANKLYYQIKEYLAAFKNAKP